MTTRLTAYGFAGGVVGLAVAFDAEPVTFPFIAPETAGAVCSVTSVTESGLMTIIIGLPCESLARTMKDDGMIVMSLNPAFVRSSRSL